MYHTLKTGYRGRGENILKAALGLGVSGPLTASPRLGKSKKLIPAELYYSENKGIIH